VLLALLLLCLDSVGTLVDLYTPMGYTGATMPVYEYACSACGHRFEKLVRTVSGDGRDITCPNCQCHEAERLVSSFALASGGSPPDSPSPAPAIGGG
jgi:putative FmdB family regulatory protein